MTNEEQRHWEEVSRARQYETEHPVRAFATTVLAMLLFPVMFIGFALFIVFCLSQF